MPDFFYAIKVYQKKIIVQAMTKAESSHWKSAWFNMINQRPAGQTF